jgi:hypothetical protein
MAWFTVDRHGRGEMGDWDALGEGEEQLGKKVGKGLQRQMKLSPYHQQGSLFTNLTSGQIPGIN